MSLSNSSTSNECSLKLGICPDSHFGLTTDILKLISVYDDGKCIQVYDKAKSLLWLYKQNVRDYWASRVEPKLMPVYNCLWQIPGYPANFSLFFRNHNCVMVRFCTSLFLIYWGKPYSVSEGLLFSYLFVVPHVYAT